MERSYFASMRRTFYDEVRTGTTVLRRREQIQSSPQRNLDEHGKYAGLTTSQQALVREIKQMEEQDIISEVLA